MTRLQRLLLITFIESFATVLVERGVYFYGHARLQFGDAQNLWLALGIGACYVAGALSSHRFARRWGEKNFLITLVLGHVVAHVSLAIFAQVWPFVVINLALAAVTGAEWPVVESYVHAGRTAEQTAKAAGQFSLAWAFSVPAGMAAVGPLIKLGGWPMFACAALANVISLSLIRPLERSPVHLPVDHPQRLPEALVDRYRRLLLSSRISMLGSYTLLFLLVPLMPRIFEAFGFSVAAPALGAVVEVMRFSAFVAMFFYAGWHGRKDVLVWAAMGLPLGFFAVLVGPNLAVVIAGELVFGAAAGAAYYAALYYAMVVANASVESGGIHEGMVGSGFALGPLLGLIGLVLAPPLHNETLGLIVVVGPASALGLAGAIWAVRPAAPGYPVMSASLPRARRR